jgi:hypothetical protein
VPTDAGIEPRTVATCALAVRHSNHYRLDLIRIYKIAHMYMNVEIGNEAAHAVSFLGIHKSDFHYSVGKHTGICLGYVRHVFYV